MIAGFTMTHQRTDFSLLKWDIGLHWQRSEETAGVLRWTTWKWAFPNTADFPTVDSSAVGTHTVKPALPTGLHSEYNFPSAIFVISSCHVGCQLSNSKAVRGNPIVLVNCINCCCFVSWSHLYSHLHSCFLLLQSREGTPTICSEWLV